GDPERREGGMDAGGRGSRRRRSTRRTGGPGGGNGSMYPEGSPPFSVRVIVRMALAAWIALFSVLAAQDVPAAISALENGNFAEAARALSEILLRTPDDPDANYYLGITYFREGRPKEARPFLERATRLSPSKAPAWKALGLILLGGDDYRGASVPLAKACALDA